MKYRNVSEHVEDLADGSTAGPGEEVNLTKDETREDHNERLITEGKLIPLDKAAQKEAEASSAEGREEKEEGGK